MITRLLGYLWKLPAPVCAIRRETAVPVPMRDGATLLADIYHPLGAPNPPTVLMRSPYGRSGPFIAIARLFAGQGYTAIVQSVRGTFGSSGQFEPFFQERHDGIDTVAWIESQPWYHGKLGLHGASYLGLVQWAIAAELGDRIAAMSTAMTTSDVHASMYQGGGFRLRDFVKWTSAVVTQEHTSVRLGSLLREHFFGDPIKDVYSSLPLRTLDQEAAGREIAFWRAWMAHDDPADPYWLPLQNGHEMARVRAPVSMVGGWSDVFIGSQVADFTAMRSANSAVRLTIGPWTHSSFQAMGESIRDALDWFDIHLKGNPHGLEKPFGIRLWVHGADEWRELGAWPSGTTCLCLGANGTLTSEEPECGALTFTYDPMRPTPSLEGADLSSKTGRGDMNELAARSDVVAFDGPKVDALIELIGDVAVTLTTSATSQNHDLYICLCDVGLDGKAINITDGYKRLSQVPDDPLMRKTTVEALPVAWRLKVGHHLRLLVAAGAFPRFARNLGQDQSLADATDPRSVEITIHCGPGASFLSV